MASTANGHADVTDWDDRYYHVDQVLDRPGPRTDPDQFSPGEAVSGPISVGNACLHIIIGEELLARPVQDFGHWCRWTGM